MVWNRQIKVRIALDCYRWYGITDDSKYWWGIKKIHITIPGNFITALVWGLRNRQLMRRWKILKRNIDFFRYETNAEFDLYKKDKPHLRVRIYRNNISLAEQDIYLMSTDSVSYVIELNGKETKFRVLYGEITSRESACYGLWNWNY